MIEARHVARLDKSHFTAGKLCVAVFGPGHGEAIVLRLPNGRVGIVDGCREADDPVARLVRELLDARPLAFACLTHPHQDHYRGLGALLAELDHRVDVVWSGGVTPSFLPMLEKHAKRRMRKADVPDPHDLDSLGKLVRAFQQVLDTTGNWNMVRGACGAQKVFDEVKIHWVGPAASDETHAQIDVATHLKQLAANKKVGAFDPNVTSLALVVEWKAARVLLGGDLVVGSGKFRGWSGTHGFIPPGPYSIVNVAHHASAGAHDDELWKKLLGPGGVALVTPYQNAQNGMPPTREDVLRLLSLGWRVVVTAMPEWLDRAQGRASGLAVKPSVHTAKPTEAVAPATNTALAGHIFEGCSTECATLAVLGDDGSLLDLLVAQDAREYVLA